MPVFDGFLPLNCKFDVQKSGHPPIFGQKSVLYRICRLKFPQFDGKNGDFDGVESVSTRASPL